MQQEQGCSPLAAGSNAPQGINSSEENRARNPCDRVAYIGRADSAFALAYWHSAYHYRADAVTATLSSREGQIYPLPAVAETWFKGRKVDLAHR